MRRKDFRFQEPLVRAAVTVLCLLVLAGGAYLAVRIMLLVTPVTLAVIAALLLAALLAPLEQWLRRRRAPGWLAASVSVIALIAVVAGGLYLVGWRAVGQLSDLRGQAGQGLARLRDLLVDIVPGMDSNQLDRLTGQALAALRGILPGPVAGATSAVEVAGAALLTVILLFFFLRDGAQMWGWLRRCVPAPHRDRVDRAGRASWRALGAYTHGILAVAAVDAIGIGAALFALQVPLALSLAVLTFLAAFVPILGATVAGAAASLVTLVTNGPGDALLVLAAVILVQQIEGNLLQPVVMRRAVRLHPVVTLLAVGAGTLLAGVAGALIAVPVCAVAYHASAAYRTRGDGQPAPHRHRRLQRRGPSAGGGRAAWRAERLRRDRATAGSSTSR